MALIDERPGWRRKLISNVKLGVNASGIYCRGGGNSDDPALRLKHLECIKAGLEILDDLEENPFRETKEGEQ